jgi:hypothetical protein
MADRTSTKPSPTDHTLFLHDDGTPVSDLYLINSLLLIMVDHKNGGWAELESRYYATWRAMKRLRQAFESGEAGLITASLADYFTSTQSGG